MHKMQLVFRIILKINELNFSHQIFVILTK